MKRIEKDGKFYRMRRGVLVEIPPEWVGKVTQKQTRKDRTKEARAACAGGGNVPWKLPAENSGQDAPPRLGHRPPRRKMMPETDSARQVRVQDAVHDSEDA